MERERERERERVYERQNKEKYFLVKKKKNIFNVDVVFILFYII
jgi:hypothetical protein